MSVVCGTTAGAAESNRPVTFESESSDSNQISKLRRSLVQTDDNLFGVQRMEIAENACSLLR